MYRKHYSQRVLNKSLLHRGLNTAEFTQPVPKVASREDTYKDFQSGQFQANAAELPVVYQEHGQPGCLLPILKVFQAW